MKRILLYIHICLISLTLTCCKDDIIPDIAIGEGKCRVSATLDFKPMVPALSRSRAAGDALNDIHSLHVLIFNSSQKLLKIQEITDFSPVSESNAAEEESTPGAQSSMMKVTFNLPIELDFGKYYIYAVANFPDFDTKYSESIETAEDLKSISLEWDSENIGNNGQMMGFFTKSSTSSSSDESIVLDKVKENLHAWLRRAASKVTVAFDGSKLLDGVSIYLKSVTIKDIPSECYLGKESAVSVEYSGLIEDGESITYGEGEEGNHTAWPTISNKTPYFYYIDPENKEVVQAAEYASNEEKYRRLAHGENNHALYFFENMQGEGNDKRQQDNDGDGKPDIKPDKDGKPYGTYIEVEAYYNSDNPESLGSGIIKYRFMLGKNVTTNFDAERNHHYKLTLSFNRLANDPDWHIYKERYFGMTTPKVMNYQGKYFVPEIRDDVNYNKGHEFSSDNIVTVTSYDENIETGERNPVEWTVTYRDEGQTGFTTACDWLTYVELTDDQKKLLEIPVTFHASIPDRHVTLIDIDANLQAEPAKGSAATPYNLADPGNPHSVKNTANSYMVDAAGWYMLPLVYGNAIEDGATNSKSYTYTDRSGEDILPVFVNHLGNSITHPYIKDNAGCVPNNAELVWQDEQNLVSNIEYVAGAYGEKGGIKFYVKPLQGNAVIGIKNTAGRIMWSWHIWVTNLKGLEEADTNIELTNHDNRIFKVLPVNLGWCSAHGEKIKYYKERRCEVEFSASGDFEKKTVTFIKKSHIALPLGNNTYYQWGRKDPFVGTNASWANKPRWDASGIQLTGHPTRFYDDSPDGTGTEPIPGFFDGEPRQTTREVLHLHIQYPDLWHNPPREEIPNPDNPNNKIYKSVNLSFANLWAGNAINDINYKTVYDPCPVGYHVSPWKTFTGFTTTGDNSSTETAWYNVDDNNLYPGHPIDGLYEFYTNSDKLQSIVFPESGYRDWDGSAQVYWYYVGPSAGQGFIWTSHYNDQNTSVYLHYSRTGGKFILPQDNFYNCDGCPIRPTVYDIQSP